MFLAWLRVRIIGCMRNSGLIVGALLVLGCSEETVESDPPVENPPVEVEGEVRAKVGPDGGELVGKAGTELEGVKLVIPPGALESEVEVWLRPTFDGDALPELSERVGLQVEVGSDGDLAQPATLTLPFDAGQVARFGEAGEGVKVWVKGEGDTWSLVEADGTSDSDVTIALETFTTAAAGVKILGSAAVCGAGCDALAQAHFDVANCGATSACVTKIVSRRLVETFDFALSPSGVIGYLSPEGSSLLAVTRAIESGVTTTSPLLPPGTSLRNGTHFVGDTFFAGLGSAGNIAFNGTSKPKAFDVGAGLGVITTKSGKTLRLSRDATTGNLTGFNHQTGKSLKLPALPIPGIKGSVTQVVSPRDANSIMVIAVNNVIELKLSASGDELSETARIELPASMQVAGSKLLQASDEIMVIAVLAFGKVAVSVDAAPFELLTLGFAASSVAVDDQGRVLVGSAKSPELVLQEQSGLPTGIRLSDAAATAPEFTSLIPRAIQAGEQGFVVLTQDRNFLSLELQ